MILPPKLNNQESLLPALLIATLPLFVIALTICVLGHYSPRGRRRAGPALWLIAVTPGGLALVHLIAAFGLGYASSEVAMISVGIMSINMLIVLLLRGRILKASPEELACEHLQK